MGVPSFYRWLANKYPKVVVNCIEENGDNINIDTTSPNPNGIEFDNLYLDMNGIIHPCFHPGDDDGFEHPNNFEDVFENMLEYIDRLFSIVRPRKLLYLAIDGVAPRAKMNQQRTRRFRNARDQQIADQEEENLRTQFEKEGKPVLPKEEPSEVADSNVITPGTAFMQKLSKALEEFIASRFVNHLGWRNIEVILSNANVPGEGEHKIVSFIRRQRSLSNYNPNTRHCIYGLDADLIMLALATHEVHFSILREDVTQRPVQQYQVVETFHSEANSTSAKCRGWCKNVLENDNNIASFVRKTYQFLHVWILREYLEIDMQINDPPENFKFDLERIIDDFIFICFFNGNDFLPHLPTLEIHEGAIDLLMTVYKKEFKNIGGYLIDMTRLEDKKGGFIKLSRVERFILLIGSYEDKIFKKRSELRERKLRRLFHDSEIDEDIDFASSLSYNADEKVPLSSGMLSEMLKNTEELKEKLKGILKQNADLFKTGDFAIDKVKLGHHGHKERYYTQKFLALCPEIVSIRGKVVLKYAEGLIWVLLYYFSEPPSWTWFYPYHYGPFASDLKGLSQVKVSFQKGSPFKPFDQLMGVLPPKSCSALPKPYQALMIDESSNILDFYPTDFEIDMDGKRFAWQGICKLPFIDEERLLFETRKLEKELGSVERERNSEQFDQLFIRRTHSFADQLSSLSLKQRVKMDANLGFEIGGFVSVQDIKEHKNNQKNFVWSLVYELPDCGVVVPRLLDGVEPPDKNISEADIQETPLWHEYQGARPPPPLAMRYLMEDKKRNGNDNKDVYKGKFKSNSSYSEPIYKGAGSGWGRGRGRGKPNNGHNANPSNNQVYFSASSRGTRGSNESWRVVSSSQDELKGFKDFRVSSLSSTSQFGSWQNNRIEQGHDNFWPTRNGFGRGQHKPDNISNWKQRSQSSTNGRNQHYT